MYHIHGSLATVPCSPTVLSPVLSSDAVLEGTLGFSSLNDFYDSLLQVPGGVVRGVGFRCNSAQNSNLPVYPGTAVNAGLSGRLGATSV